MPDMYWRIEQQGAHEWRVFKGCETHFAQTAEAAVELKIALERAESAS